MPFTSLSYFKDSGVVYTLFKCLVLCNEIENVSRGEADQSMAKKQQSIDIFLFKHISRF